MNYCQKFPPIFFPYLESNWIENDEYDFISMQKLKQERNNLVKSTQKRIHEIDENLSMERGKYEFIYDIVENTGDDLVNSVKKCLELIGFKDVEDVDKEIEKEGKKKRRFKDMG